MGGCGWGKPMQYCPKGSLQVSWIDHQIQAFVALMQVEGGSPSEKWFANCPGTFVCIWRQKMFCSCFEFIPVKCNKNADQCLNVIVSDWRCLWEKSTRCNSIPEKSLKVTGVWNSKIQTERERERERERRRGTGDFLPSGLIVYKYIIPSENHVNLAKIGLKWAD